MKPLIFNRVNLLFLALLAVVCFLPSRREIDGAVPYLVVLGLSELLFLVQYGRSRKKSALDVGTIAFLILGFWDVMSRLNLTNPVLVPPPENVFFVFVDQRVLMLQSVASSLRLMLISVGIALVLGVGLGLFVGWLPRLRGAVMPIAHVISPIPALVTTPYIVAIMPTFQAASVFVICFSVFFPTFQSMVQRVASIDRRIIQSAEVMNVSTPTMLFKIILPCCLPGILSGLTGTMRVALLCLSGAELLGAQSGLGYFVKKFSDYANYTQVIAGIILMGIVVTVLTMLIELLQRRAIRWL
ncbi:MAG: ABC transporter permease subunit [Oscillospiraceae bacterium]|nr:ABC transporter permease subunit [Oscillospiraceae bacterium]